MRAIILPFIILSLCFYGCKSHSNSGDAGHAHETTEEHAAHSHEGEGHKHEGEDHKCDGHDHEGEEHKHEGEDHKCDGHDHEGKEHNHEGEGHDHEHEAEAGAAHSDEIIFTKAQAAKTDFEVKEIQPGTFNQVIKSTGQIQAAPGDESVIVATSNGVISYNSNITEGRAVNKGQTLFSIASKNMAEGDLYSKVRGTYDKAKAEYERAESLVKDKIISQREFEAIRLDYENARLAFDAIAGTHTGKGVGVVSPLGGYIKNILVKEGEYVTTGQALGTVSQNKRLILRAEVSEKHYNSLKNINSANFKTPYDNKVYVLSELNGKILSFGKASNTNNFYIPVSFEFDNKGDVIPGTFTEVYLISAPVENALAIPASALTNEMGLFYVYVQLDDEGYRKQEVSVGANNGREVQIIKGLQPGDRVVTKGAYQVKMASASGAIPHGHSHEH